MTVRRFASLVVGGGTCLNRGCIPTKTMIASAKAAQQVRRAAELGVHTDGGSLTVAAADRSDVP